MGGCVSRRSSSSFTNVRVVHFSGYVEDFDQPVTVRHLTGKSADAEHFVCTPAQLVSAVSSPSLKPDTLLEPGKIYFLLPYSTLHPDVSPMDLASISKKLAAAAKSSRPQPGITRANSGCREWNSPARSPGRSPEGEGMMVFGAQKSAWSQSWRPILDTINEKPLNQGSESDLQEKLAGKRNL